MTDPVRPYLPGERVSVTFAGAEVLEFGGRRLRVRTADTEITFDPRAYGCTLMRTAPADGVPSPGELWQDACGRVWFVRGSGRPNDEPSFVGGDSRDQHPGRTHESWLNVHRQHGPIRRIWAPAAEIGDE